MALGGNLGTDGGRRRAFLSAPDLQLDLRGLFEIGGQGSRSAGAAQAAYLSDPRAEHSQKASERRPVALRAEPQIFSGVHADSRMRASFGASENVAGDWRSSNSGVPACRPTCRNPAITSMRKPPLLIRSLRPFTLTGTPKRAAQFVSWIPNYLLPASWLDTACLAE